MKITEIANKIVKLSKHSITVKDEQNKTRGVVRGVTPFKELRPAEQMKYWKQLRECGLWCSEFMNCFIICDGEAYYLHNLKAIEDYKKYFEQLGYENDRKKYEQRLEIAEKVKQFATVIPCYLLTAG